ncbi:MAG: Zn-dependent oligopeptidase [Calditrichia bacterium]
MTIFKRVLLSLLTLFFVFGALLVGNLAAETDSPAQKDAAAAFSKKCESDLNQAGRILDQLQNFKGTATVQTVLEPLNDFWTILDRNQNITSLYQNVHPDPDIRAAAAEYEQKFSKLETEMQLSRPVFDAVSALDVSKEDAGTQRYVQKLLQDFRRAGVDKDPETRQKIRQLQDELVKISQEFGRNIREDVRYLKLDSPDELAGLPQDYIQAHQPGPEGKITLSTDYPDYLPFMSYAKSDARRSEFYKLNRQRGYPANVEVMQNMLEKRYELARLLGYDNYAQYETENKMVRTPRAAQEFIDKVAEVAGDRAKTDYDELLARLQKEIPGAKAVGSWQYGYISELVKKESYDFDSQELRQYFPYDRVKQGLFDITGKMFGVTYKKADVPVWDSSVEAYEMWSGDELIGRFYLDMHPRKNKYQHAMMSQVITGVKGRQLPEAALVCNFPGGDGTPGLMEHEQVSTFFHEFGHLLHHLFAGDQRWVGISGIAMEWDFVETPSTMLEEWTWSPEILKTFAVNAAGDTIPGELISKMLQARNCGLGLDTRQQIFYSAVSLNFYNRDPKRFNPDQMVRELQAEYTPFAFIDGTHMQLSFGHLDEYSAVYYTYQWSTVIAKDLFSVFQKNGLLNPEVALSYRHKILEQGGLKHAADMVRDFLGRDYSFDAFRNSLYQN